MLGFAFLLVSMTIQDLLVWRGHTVPSALDSAAYVVLLIFWAKAACQRHTAAMSVLVSTPA